MSDIIKKVSLKVWLLGLLWAAVAACYPVGILLYDWVHRWDDPPDWTMVWHLAVGCALAGAIAYVRKHRALLQLPPALEEARSLARESAEAAKQPSTHSG